MFGEIGTEEIAYGVGALVLLIGIGYGLLRNIGRNKRVDRVTEAATKEQYEHPERYQRTQKKFEREAERVKEQGDRR